MYFENDNYEFFVPQGSCNICEKHPSFFFKNKCILCLRHNNIDYESSPFFNDRKQLNIRKFLINTDDDFRLLGYNLFDDDTISEGWLCNKCNKILIFQLIYPSITRDNFHFSKRLDHMKKCNNTSCIEL